MAIPLPRDVEKLLTQYLDPLSSSHLVSNQDRLLKNIQRDCELYPMPAEAIQRFKQSLEWESKVREYNLLRGKKRYLSYRRYITFDNSMLAGLHNKSLERQRCGSSGHSDRRKKNRIKDGLPD